MKLKVIIEQPKRGKVLRAFVQDENGTRGTDLIRGKGITDPRAAETKCSEILDPKNNLLTRLEIDFEWANEA